MRRTPGSSGGMAEPREIEALEHALAFVAQLELSGDERSDSESDARQWRNASAATATAAGPHAGHELHRSHSLEMPADALESQAARVAGDASESLADAPSSSTALEPDAATSRRLDTTTSRLLRIARTSKARPASRRQELQSLRKTAEELSRQLQALRAPSASASPTTSPTASPTAQADACVWALMCQSKSMWEQIAARQRAARRSAEEENCRLWTAVDQQVRHAKNLKRKLRRQTQATDLARAAALKHAKPRTLLESQRVLADLERSMDALYVSVDKQFADADMRSLSTPGRRRQVKRDAVNGVFLQLLDAHAVPFELRATEAAVWASVGERGLRYRHGRWFMPMSSSESDSTIQLSYAFDVHAFDSYHRVRCHRVARKYAEASRSVVVCQSVIQPLQQQSGEPVGLQFLETQLLAVTRDAQTPSESVIQSLMTITRLELEGEPIERYRGDVYVDFAIRGWSQSKDKDNQLVENLLMEELLTLS